MKNRGEKISSITCVNVFDKTIYNFEIYYINKLFNIRNEIARQLEVYHYQPSCKMAFVYEVSSVKRTKIILVQFLLIRHFKKLHDPFFTSGRHKIDQEL